MPIRAIIFDLDQTILDRSASLSAFLSWQTNRVLKPDIENSALFISRFLELDNNGRVWKDEVYSQLIEEFEIKAWKMEELLSIYETCFCAFCVPRLGVDQAIQKLSENYRLGLISNGKTPFQERNFRALGYSGVFGSIVVSEAAGYRKPEAKIFHLGCSQLNVSPEETVFVGDSPSADIQGAQEAGLKAIFVPSELNPVCEDADETCEEMSHLPTLITKLGEQGDVINH